MRALRVGVVCLIASPAIADDALPASSGVPIELGVYTGGFISNYYHQFYDIEAFPGGEGDATSREDLRKLNPLAGLRLAYFPKPWLGIEGEFNTIFVETKMSERGARIFGGRLQLMLQIPTPHVVPYVAIGDGFDHVSSPDTVLGSDTDWPVHAGVGVRFLAGRSITIRVDGRFLRAPSQQAPYTLNASLAEFMVGLSWRPSRTPAEPDLPPPPPPEPQDTDLDGILDPDDKCVNEPEDKDLFDDSDGCPDPDNDNDGISDLTDKCALEAEDKDGFQDDDGCIDKDNDGDTVNDNADKCPAEPEDKDGFEDLDGCPETDNDKDSFFDTQDKCPNESEIINGVDDDDGCPDRGNALVVVSPDRLELLESIEFDKKNKLKKASLNLLAQIGAQLRKHTEIQRVRITVHVQPTKKEDADQKLSEKRAAVIRDWLINYGIEAKRLEQRGFGGTKPLVPAKQKGSKAINERVDLIILERK